MKILHITSLSNNKSSGIANIVPKHIEHQSYNNKVIWLNVSKNYHWPNLDKPIKIDFSTNDNINHILNKYCDIQIAIFHGIYFREYLRISKELSKRKIPYIIVPHGSLTKFAVRKKYIKKMIALKLYFNRFIKQASAFHFLSLGEQKNLYQKIRKPSITVSNGIEVSVNKQKRINENGTIKGVYVGRKDIRFKGLDLFIKACYLSYSNLIKNNVEIHIYGPEVDNSNIKLQKLINKFNLNEVIYIHDGVYGSEKYKVYNESDFFVLTSRSEGHPVGLIEAMAYGMPALVSFNTNLGEEINNHNSGWVAEELSAKEISKQINLICSTDKDTLDLKSKNAFNHAKEYSWEKIVKTTVKEYQEILCRSINEY